VVWVDASDWWAWHSWAQSLQPWGTESSSSSSAQWRTSPFDLR
jgi:hypothetical protein